MACPIVSFCGPNKLILVDCLPCCCTVCIDAQVHLYSHWKQAIIDGCLSAGFEKAFDTTGGDPVTASQNLSGYYFLTNGWRVKPAERDASYLVEGNLFVCGGGVHPFVNTCGSFNTFVAINTSAQSLTTTVCTGSGVTPCDVATIVDAVWDEALACHVAAGSTGAKLDVIPTSGTGDWSNTEKENIRAVLGIDGTKTDPTGADGTIQKLFKRVKFIITLLFTK